MMTKNTFQQKSRVEIDSLLQLSLSTTTLLANPGPKVIKLFSCSTQLRLKFVLLINFKMPTIVGILTFINRIHCFFLSFEHGFSTIFNDFSIYSLLDNGESLRGQTLFF